MTLNEKIHGALRAKDGFINSIRKMNIDIDLNEVKKMVSDSFGNIDFEKYKEYKEYFSQNRLIAIYERYGNTIREGPHHEVARDPSLMLIPRPFLHFAKRNE